MHINSSEIYLNLTKKEILGVGVYEKKQSISSLSEGDEVKDIFVVKIKKGLYPYKGKSGLYFKLLLSDNSGKTLEYRYWGNENEEEIKKIYNSIKNDSVLYIEGKVSTFNGKLQLSSEGPSSIRVLKKGEYDENEFIKPPKRDVEKMYSELVEEIYCVENPQIKKLLESIFKDPEIEKKFKKHPGGIEIHHNWRGGLLQHTLEVLQYCKLSWQLFPDLNKDLLVAGALLHDIGKLEEISVTSRIKGTDRGQLLGHIVLGANYVSRKMDDMDMDEKLKDKILHMIISHHGRVEYGSPKEPMYSEAIVLYYADEMSSKIAEMDEFIRNSKEDTEDDFMYNKRKGRNIFLK